MTDITDFNASELSERIHQGQFSCTEVMQAYLQRIQALNPAMAALLGAPAGQLHGRALGSVAPQLAQALLQRRLKILAVDAPATLQTLLTAVLQQAQTRRQAKQQHKRSA